MTSILRIFTAGEHNEGSIVPDAFERIAMMAKPQTRLCSSCHYWLPSDHLTYLGECANPKSANLKKPIWADKVSGTCFNERSFERLQFLWCQTCHLTISSFDLPDHPNCMLFAGAAQIPVEDMVEFTLAGD